MRLTLNQRAVDKKDRKAYTFLGMRAIPLILVLTIVFGSPAHCLAKALNAPQLGRTLFGPSEHPSPKVGPTMHCCHPEGLLSSAPRAFFAATRSDFFTPQALAGQPPAPLEILPLNHGPPGGPSASLAHPAQPGSFPLLI